MEAILSNIKAPNIFKIVKNDYITALCVIFPFVLFTISSITYYTGYLPDRRGNLMEVESLAPLFLYIGIALLVLGIWISVTRIKIIIDTFNKGIVIQGEITCAEYFKDRGRIEFKYRFDGIERKKGMGIMQSKTTKGLQTGEIIDIIIDKRNPDRAFILQFFN